MGDTEYRTIRLTEDAYRKLKSHKQSGESFSEVVERLAGKRSLLDLTGTFTEDEVDEMRDAIQEQEDKSREYLDRCTGRMDP
ncbi:antitoxin VapB family protein [Natronorubrum daqingense]|uniref:Predicted antitoxin, CopG family n=1 Tax=Natronorubrum daqingense TaxID=588898 RepID=A0A1N6XLW1_9EURY|nr:antitoxin VapB family protein [Natronorubrum daqingense]APX95917.1 hypothetical protein BB347_04405 [Natronorubrum daqingense]SIR03302.1 Predicted antitoxin, CopG family [Natronorubrum daqingense]